ncbi:MAG: Fic family protein [Acidithiobacillus ferrivorans]
MGVVNPFYAKLDADIKATLLAQIRNLWTHTSTAIEGNSLTLGDTAFVLEEGLTVAGKPLRDHQEIYGHAKAIEIVYAWMDKQSSLQEEDLFALHRTVLTEAVMDIYKPVGKWKNESNFTNYIGNDDRQHLREFPAPKKVPTLMSQWLEKLNQFCAKPLTGINAVGAYASLHLDFVTIHPFFDGNGRVARLISNLPVLRSGFPPIVVPTEARQEYKRSISDYQATIPELERLETLSGLPDNLERDHFRGLCRSYWEPTQTLLREAMEMQEKRDVQRSAAPEHEEDHGAGDNFGR